jgi:hypothetical protein
MREGLFAAYFVGLPGFSLLDIGLEVDLIASST